MEGNDFGSATLITVLRIRDAYPGDPDSRVKKIPDAGSESVFLVFLALKTVSQLSEKLSGMFIPDPDFSHPGSRGQKICK
jgi:hypothetical protein